MNPILERSEVLTRFRSITTEAPGESDPENITNIMKFIHEEVDDVFSWGEMRAMRSSLWQAVKNVRQNVEGIVRGEGWRVLKRKVDKGAFELTIDGVEGRKPEH